MIKREGYLIAELEVNVMPLFFVSVSVKCICLFIHQCQSQSPHNRQTTCVAKFSIDRQTGLFVFTSDQNPAQPGLNKLLKEEMYWLILVESLEKYVSFGGAAFRFQTVSSELVLSAVL